MKIRGTIWFREVVDKLLVKHGVTTEEVDEVLEGSPHFRRLERGRVDGEDLFAAFGRTAAGRYLTVILVYKGSREALIVSARNSTRRERRTYGRQS